MILRYTPRDGAPQLWDLATIRFLTSEAETLERTTSIDWGDLCSRRLLVVKKSPTARRAICWVLLKRSVPALRYAAFDPAVTEIDVKLGADDVTELLGEMESELAAGRITEEEAEEGARDLDVLIDPDVLAERAAAGTAAAVGSDGPKEPAAEPAPEPAGQEPAPGSGWGQA